jgi:oligogalacturonide lyase
MVGALVLWLACAPQAQGQVGRDWGVEQQTYVDPVTGVTVREIATAGTNDNLYFHVSNFTADNRYLLFSSTRTGTSQLYRADVASGRIVQLTDDPKGTSRGATPDHTNPRRVYLQRGAAIVALDIETFTETKVGAIPGPAIGGFGQPSLNGAATHLALTVQRDEGSWEIGRMDVRTGEYRAVITQGFRIGHVQHSPTDDLIFYVWETGGYAPQRTWVVNADGTRNRPFYARTDRKTWVTPLKEWITHEAWIAGTGELTLINDKQGVMIAGKDGSARMVKEGDYWHVAARPDGRFLVVDDNKGRLWLLETATGATRLLATGIRDAMRAVHAHASFDRKGDYIQFHTGRTRETVALIDLRTLPPLGWR